MGALRGATQAVPYRWVGVGEAVAVPEPDDWVEAWLVGLQPSRQQARGGRQSWGTPPPPILGLGLALPQPNPTPTYPTPHRPSTRGGGDHTAPALHKPPHATFTATQAPHCRDAPTSEHWFAAVTDQRCEWQPHPR